MTHIAGIEYNDTANAPGVCVSVYVSGCDFHCKGCHNPEAWDYNYGKEASIEDIYEIEESLHANGIERNLCILGGEPLNKQNIAFVLGLISYVKSTSPNTKIYLWTGFTIEDLLIKDSIEKSAIYYVLNNVDVLIDGSYIEEQRDITLPMRGSKNQRIHYLKENKYE